MTHTIVQKILRPDQLNLKLGAYQAWNSGLRNVLIQLATGGGKSVVMSDIVLDGHNQNLKQVVIAHRTELVAQMSMHIAERGIKHRIIAPKKVIRQITNMHRKKFGGFSYISPEANCAVGGVDTITVREYQALSKRKQFAYRVYRNPLFLIILGTPIYVILAQRIPFNQGTGFYEDYQTLPMRSIWKSIMLTNVFIIGFYGGLGLLIGFATLFAIYLPILIVTAWIGGWMFFVQHQFEDTYWEQNENWTLQESALMGSSYYELPKFFQWFSGNIGLHHIHHLSSKIPNYKLQACMDAQPALKNISKLTFKESLQCVHLKLWDEETNQLIGIPSTNH